MDIQSLIGSAIEIVNVDNEIDSYFEVGMRARVVSCVLKHNDYYEMALDLEEFADHNFQYETSNYYDKDGCPTLTAREAGFYKPIDIFYLPLPSEEQWIPNYFTILDQKKIALLEKFEARPDRKQTYISWLEDQINV